MTPEDLEELVNRRTAEIDVDDAWRKLKPGVRAARRKGRVLVALPIVLVLALGGSVVALMSNDDDRTDLVTADSVATGGSQPDTSSTSSTEAARPTTSPTSASVTTSPPAPPPSVPVEATLGAFIERAGRSDSGQVTLTLAGLDGRQLQFAMTSDVARLLAPLRIAMYAYVTCNAVEDCGSAEISADTWPESIVAEEALVKTLRAADGREVLLVDTRAPTGRVLRWLQDGWRLDVSVARIPESAYSLWLDNLRPVVNEHGWLTVVESQPFQVSGPSGPQALFFANHASAPIDNLQVVPSPECSSEDGGQNELPGPDGSPNLVIGECAPGTGVVITIDGKPDAVRGVQAGLTVRAPN